MRKLTIDFIILIGVLLIGTIECWLFLVYSANNPNLTEAERNWLFIYNYMHSLGFSFWLSYVIVKFVFREKE